MNGIRPGPGGRLRAGPETDPQTGGASVELALTLPAVVLLILVLLGAGAAVTAQVQCADAARVAARAAMVGASDAQVADAARAVAGPRSEVGVERDGEWVSVTVSRPVSPAGLGTLTVGGRATARLEPLAGGP